MNSDPTGCAVHPEAQPGATKPNAQPAPAKLDPTRRYHVTVRADDPSLGSATAPVTLVVFSDFECPFCGRLEPVLSELRTTFGEKLRVVWKDLPLPMHAFALPSAVLAREAYVKHGNERFWQVHDQLFQNQPSLSDTWLAGLAKSYDLTWPPDEGYVPRIQQNVYEADELAIRATPTTFINGRPVVGAQDESTYASIVRQELEPRGL